MKNTLSLVSATILIIFQQVMIVAIIFYLTARDLNATNESSSLSFKGFFLNINGEQIPIFESPYFAVSLVFATAVSIVLFCLVFRKTLAKHSYLPNHYFLYGLGLLLALVTLTFFIPQLRSDFVEKLLTTKNLPFLLLGVGLLVPIFEELLFRGVLMHKFLESMDFWKANLYTSLLFTAMHMQYNILLLLFVFSISWLLGWVFAKGGSLGNTILLHAFNNTAAILLSYYST